MTVGHGLGGGRARRVQQTDHAEQLQVLVRLDRRGVVTGVDHASSQRQHAQALTGEGALPLQPFVAVGVGERLAVPARRRAGHDRTRSALDGHQRRPGRQARPTRLGHTVVGGHHLGVAVERDLALLRSDLQQVLAAPDARGDGGTLQGRLHGVAHVVGGILLPQGGVAAQRGDRQRGPGLLVALPDRRQLDGGGPGLQHRDRHAALGQGAGLVGEHHGGRTQRLHRRQPLDQRVAPRHAHDPTRQGEGGDDGQALGHRGDGQRDGRLDHLLHVLPDGDADTGHDDTDADHGHDEGPAELVELSFQRRLVAVVGLLHQAGDLTDLGVGPGCDDHAAGGPDGDAGALEDHRSALGQRGVGLDRLDGLGLRGGLTGQRCLVDLQVGHLDQPEVGGDDVTLLQLHDVSGHQVGGCDLGRGAVPGHHGGGPAQLAQRLHRLQGPVLRHEADHRVDQHRDEDGDRLDDLAGQQRRQPGGDQNAHDRGEELVDHQPPQRRAFLLGDLVGAVSRQAAFRLVAGQAPGGVDVEGARHLLHRG